jgi:hypothetical protein
VASAAFLLRTAAVALFAAWVADALLDKRWRLAARRACLAALPVIAWQGYILHVERSAAYVNPSYAYARADYALYNVSYTRNMLLRDPTRPQLGRATVAELPGRTLANLRTTVFHLGEAVSLLERDWVTLMLQAKEHPVAKRFIPWGAIPLSLLTFGMFVAGGAILYLFSPHRLIPLVLLGYIGLLSLLPTDYHWPRYFAGMAPLVVACFLRGATAVYDMRDAHKPRLLRRLPIVIPVVVVAGALSLQVIAATWYFRYDHHRVTHAFGDGAPVTYRMFTYDQPLAAFDAGLDWIARTAGRDDVLVTSMPHWVYLRTGRRSVIPPFEPDVDAAADLLKSVRPRFVIIDSSGFSAAKAYAAPVMINNPSDWTLEWEDAGRLLQIYASAATRTEARDTAGSAIVP